MPLYWILSGLSIAIYEVLFKTQLHTIYSLLALLMSADVLALVIKL